MLGSIHAAEKFRGLATDPRIAKAVAPGPSLNGVETATEKIGSKRNPQN
jgi:hypothetical protein